MIAEMVEPPRWPRRRWILWMLVLMSGQVAFIFWLSGMKNTKPQPITYGPKIYLPENARVAWPELSDAAQYVLANSQGFSGEAWLNIAPMEYDLPKWTDEQVRPLKLPVAQLGLEAKEFLRTNLTADFELATKPDPQFDVLAPEDNLGNPQSALTMTGALTNRALVGQLKLPSWPDNEILTNSEVGVAVDGSGNVFSAVLLGSCGSNSDTNALRADEAALRMATAARFAPLPSGLVRFGTASGSFQWGKMVFHWHTIPLTNVIAPAL